MKNVGMSLESNLLEAERRPNSSFISIIFLHQTPDPGGKEHDDRAQKSDHQQSEVCLLD